jgi:hypothetical protein
MERKIRIYKQMMKLSYTKKGNELAVIMSGKALEVPCCVVNRLVINE